MPNDGMKRRKPNERQTPALIRVLRKRQVKVQESAAEVKKCLDAFDRAFKPKQGTD